MRNFTCGVKHNFNTGVIVLKDDRKNYMWNCSTCGIQEKMEDSEDTKDFKANNKVISPLLSYE
ncbi:MAG: hypothetical protein ACFFCE_15785 [Promethearchaeota archaeon]